MATKLRALDDPDQLQPYKYPENYSTSAQRLMFCEGKVIKYMHDLGYNTLELCRKYGTNVFNDLARFICFIEDIENYESNLGLILLSNQEQFANPMRMLVDATVSQTAFIEDIIRSYRESMNAMIALTISPDTEES